MLPVGHKPHHRLFMQATLDAQAQALVQAVARGQQSAARWSSSYGRYHTAADRKTALPASTQAETASTANVVNRSTVDTAATANTTSAGGKPISTQPQRRRRRHARTVHSLS